MESNYIRGELLKLMGRELLCGVNSLQSVSYELLSEPMWCAFSEKEKNLETAISAKSHIELLIFAFSQNTLTKGVLN